MLTVALPSAQILADRSSRTSGTPWNCKSLFGELDKPEEERGPGSVRSPWPPTSRCFSKGKRFGLGPDDIISLPLEARS